MIKGIRCKERKEVNWKKKEKKKSPKTKKKHKTKTKKQQKIQWWLRWWWWWCCHLERRCEKIENNCAYMCGWNIKWKEIGDKNRSCRCCCWQRRWWLSKVGKMPMGDCDNFRTDVEHDEDDGGSDDKDYGSGYGIGGIKSKGRMFFGARMQLSCDKREYLLKTTIETFSLSGHSTNRCY